MDGSVSTSRTLSFTYRPDTVLGPDGTEPLEEWLLPSSFLSIPVVGNRMTLGRVIILR